MYTLIYIYDICYIWQWIIICNANNIISMQQQQKSYQPSQQYPPAQYQSTTNHINIDTNNIANIQSSNIQITQQPIQPNNTEQQQQQHQQQNKQQQIEQLLTVQYRQVQQQQQIQQQIQQQQRKQIDHKSKIQSVNDRALELVYRMVRQRKQRQQQSKNKYSPSSNNIIPNNSNNNTKINNSHSTIQPKYTKIGNIRKNIDHGIPTAIRKNRMYASIDFHKDNNSNNVRYSTYEQNIVSARRSLNIGKIVKVTNTHHQLDIALDKAKLYSPYPQSPAHANNPKLTNLPPISPRNPIINSPIVYQKQRQLYILDQSKRRTQTYQLKKYITNIIFDICDQAVERIQQKRTFFSYRIHRKLYGKSRSKEKIDDPVYSMSIANRFSQTIHPKHERSLQSANYLHQSYMMSRVRKLKGQGQLNEELDKNDGINKYKGGKSRIEPVFSYTFNTINEANKDEGEGEGEENEENNDDNDENSQSDKQNSEDQQNGSENSSNKQSKRSNSQSQSQSKNESDSQSQNSDEAKNDDQSQKSSQQSEQPPKSSQLSNENQTQNQSSKQQDKTKQQEDKYQTNNEPKTNQPTNQQPIKTNKKYEQSMPITHKKQLKPISNINRNKYFIAGRKK